MNPLTSYKARQTVALAWLAVSACCSADVITAAITISARYQQACSITSTIPVFDFGTITSNTSVQYASGTLVVNCDSSAQTPFGVWAPLSANANGMQRRMKNNNTSAGNYLNYNLLIGDTGSTLISNTSTTTGFANPQKGTLSTTVTGVLLRAQMPSGQTLTQGYYSDDLVLTVSY